MRRTGINILGTCEVRRQDKRVRMSERCKIIYSEGSKHEHGVAVVLDRNNNKNSAAYQTVLL